MTTYIAVRTRRPQDIEAFLWSNAKIVGKSHEDLGSTVMLVEVEGTEAQAQNQADRLSSGLHGAKVLPDLAAVSEWSKNNAAADLAEGV